MTLIEYVLRRGCIMESVIMGGAASVQVTMGIVGADGFTNAMTVGSYLM